MIEEITNTYKIRGEFTLKSNEDLLIKCNAPTQNAGIYLIYLKEKLIYIGSSGRKINGKLKVRETGLGGIKDRIVNGYHPKFGKIKRKKIFPIIMKESNIDEIIFKWYITYDEIENFHFPTDIEKSILSIYKKQNKNEKPIWHK